MPKECVLYDRVCKECGECDICDLDSTKKCDNCAKCIDGMDEYRSLNLDEFMTIQEEKDIIKKKRNR